MIQEKNKKKRKEKTCTINLPPFLLSGTSQTGWIPSLKKL